MGDTKKKQMPVYNCKAGSVEGAVWEQDGENGKFLSVSVQRSYLDKKDTTDGKEGTWKKTNTYRVNDLPTLQLVTQKCFEYAKIKAKETSNDE